MCQILVDTKAPGEGPLPRANNVELTEAANKVISGMDGVGGHWFVSARQLGNGGVLLDLDGNEAAHWLGMPTMQAGFIGRFAPEATVKDPAFPVMVQFVPLHFKLDRTADLCQLEDDNGLSDGSILRSR